MPMSSFILILRRVGGLPDMRGKIRERARHTIAGTTVKKAQMLRINTQIEDERAVCVEATDTEKKQCVVEIW